MLIRGCTAPSMHVSCTPLLNSPMIDSTATEASRKAFYALVVAGTALAAGSLGYLLCNELYLNPLAANHVINRSLDILQSHPRVPHALLMHALFIAGAQRAERCRCARIKRLRRNDLALPPSSAYRVSENRRRTARNRRNAILCREQGGRTRHQVNGRGSSSEVFKGGRKHVERGGNSEALD